MRQMCHNCTFYYYLCITKFFHSVLQNHRTYHSLSVLEREKHLSHFSEEQLFLISLRSHILKAQGRAKDFYTHRFKYLIAKSSAGKDSMLQINI